MFRTRLAATILISLSGCMSDLGRVGGPGDGFGAGPDAGAPEAQGRVTAGLQVLYDFKEEIGSTFVRDVAEVGPPADLVIADAPYVTWGPSGGIHITEPTVITSGLPPTKLYSACTTTNQLTLEAWIRPASLDQTGARIVSYAIDTRNRNFSLHQDGDRFYAPVRTTDTNPDGEPYVEAPAGTATGAIQHVVLARNGIETALYVNGAKVATSPIAGDFSEWDPGYRLALGNEVSGDRPWLGDIYLVAVYCRKLTDDEVAQNFAARF